MTEISGFTGVVGDDDECLVIKQTGLTNEHGAPIHGDADHAGSVIRIDPTDSEQMQLDCVIHECLHLCFPWMREWLVDRTATQIAQILWDYGFRLKGERKDATVGNT